MKRFSLFIIVICVLFIPLLSGCGTKSNVAGTWVMEEDSFGIGVGVKLTLKDDGTALMGPLKAKYKVDGTNVLVTDKDGKEILTLVLKEEKLVSAPESSRKVVYKKE
ncbi:MAG: hypothetical protein U9N32_10400 [Spirochaetota bacterium]|nr:hypothetical protein [Spirochaetota bacterium]